MMPSGASGGGGGWWPPLHRLRSQRIVPAAAVNSAPAVTVAVNKWRIDFNVFYSRL